MDKKERQELAIELLKCKGFVLFEESLKRAEDDMKNNRDRDTLVESLLRFQTLQEFKNELLNETNA